MLVDHDQFAKEVLRVLMQPLAEVESEHEALHEALALCVVARPRLPRTLPLRLLGVGRVRAQAAADLGALRRDDPIRGAMAELVVRDAFVRQISGTGPASKEDALVERLLRASFGSVDEAASTRLEAATEEQLTAIALRVGQATSIEEVFREE